MSQFAGNDCVLQIPSTSLYVEQTFQEKGTGLLTIEEECLKWISDDQSDSITLNYPSISLHAISRDTTSFPYHCVYILSYSPDNGDDEPSDDEDNNDTITELRFVPPNNDDLERIYSSICQCQLLYPDPELSEDSLADEENEGEEGVEWEGLVEQDTEGGVFYTSAEEGIPNLSVEGRAVLEHLESVFVMPGADEFTRLVNEGQNGYSDGQFEDPPENNNTDHDDDDNDD